MTSSCIAARSLLRVRDIKLRLVILDNTAGNSLIKDIDLGCSKLPRTNTALKQEVKFGKRTTLGFR